VKLPPMTSGRHFDDLATSYDELRGAGRGAPYVAALVELGALRGADVLDVGCGTGELLGELVESSSVRGTGVDPSAGMLEVSRSKLAPSVRLQRASAENLPFDDASFDAATMRFVVHHLDRPTAFAEINRVLRAAGRLLITTTDPTGLAQFWMQSYFPSYAAIEQRRFPAGEVLASELADAGFRDVVIRPRTVARRFDRATALQKLHGRAYSTFAEMTEAEYRAGVAAAEAGLPEQVEYELTLLDVLAVRR
jgi:ubiquinone/menaquinone biosynthesis C-methylase UbiE